MAASTTSTSIKDTQPAKGYTVHSVSIATSTNAATLVTAVAGKRIKVIGYTLFSAAANNIAFTSDANAIGGSGTYNMDTNGFVARGISCINEQPIVLMQTNAGEALKISLSQAQAVGGNIQYYTE